MDMPIAFIEKRRQGNDAKAEALTLIGDVAGRDVIIVDDEVDTGGSIAQAVNVVKQNGARDIYLAFVHGILSNNGAERWHPCPSTHHHKILPPPEKNLEGRYRSLYRITERSSAAHEGRSLVRCLRITNSIRAPRKDWH
jgi:predicted phosphoribosyltransferase